MRDLTSNIKVLSTINPVAVGTTGTGQTGSVVDRKGYDGVTLTASYGAITGTGAVFTATVKHGDATGSMTSVADADLIGDESTLGLAAGARSDGSTENVSKRIGYVGGKRYVSLDISSTVTAGTPVSADVILSHPNQAPVAQSEFG